MQVITPSADGPADKAGIRPRDQVVQIDGKPTKGISLYDAGELLQGNEGSQVSCCSYTLPFKYRIIPSWGRQLTAVPVLKDLHCLSSSQKHGQRKKREAPIYNLMIASLLFKTSQGSGSSRKFGHIKKGEANSELDES